MQGDFIGFRGEFRVPETITLFHSLLHSFSNPMPEVFSGCRFFVIRPPLESWRSKIGYVSKQIIYD